MLFATDGRRLESLVRSAVLARLGDEGSGVVSGLSSFGTSL